MKESPVSPQKKSPVTQNKTTATATQNEIISAPEEIPALLEQATVNPASLKPKDILQLQRTLGNTAVLQLMRSSQNNGNIAAPKIQKQASPITVSKTDKKAIQRLIGFEIETRIPLYRDDGMGTGTLEKPDYDEVHSDAGTGDGAEIVVDKEGATSIIELVTPPVDDSQVSKNFAAMARTWVNALTILHGQAIAGPPPKKMDAAIGTSDDDLYYGFKPTDSNSKQDMIAIQATHGIRLDKVDTLFKKTSIPRANQARGADQLKSDAVAEVGPAMDTFMTNLETILNASTVIAKKKDRQQALKEVRGFFSLLAQYLISGGKAKTYYLKNHTMLFYKSKMSDVRNNLVGANAYAAQLFTVAYHAAVKTQLLTDTGRTGTDPLFMGSNGSTITCAGWLDEVMTGVDDSLFEEAKNPWGNAIAPGTVKGSLSAVLEHRDLIKEIKPDDNMKLTNPNLIVEYLVQVFKRNKKMQDIHHG